MRKALGIEFEGYTHPERFLILTTTYDIGTEYPGCTRNYISDPDAWCALFKVTRRRRQGPAVAGAVHDPARADRRRADESGGDRSSGCRSSCRRTARYDIVHRNLYNVHQRVAASFRKGRVFLAGDAAHVNNPLGGLGLNFGIHDAVELSDLLGRVIRREAPEDILDEYDLHRRPLNIEFVQQQTIANKKRMEEKDPAARAKNFEQLAATAADPAAHRAYLLRASLIESVKKRAAVPA